MYKAELVVNPTNSAFIRRRPALPPVSLAEHTGQHSPGRTARTTSRSAPACCVRARALSPPNAVRGSFSKIECDQVIHPFLRQELTGSDFVGSIQ